MSDISFFSSSSYIFLPTKNNQKVALCIDNLKFAKNAFKLYNPFSKKAKVFKSASKFLFITLNIFSKLLSTKKEKSDFVLYLEELLNQPLIISLYFATANDKVVLQLQSPDAQIIGYLKYPLNEVGLKHINNEIRAFEILSSEEVVEPYILKDTYNEKPFLLLKELDGTIDRVEKESVKSILKSFEKESSYVLSEHPRVQELKKQLLSNGMTNYITKLENICDSSSTNYKIVYEHGDFTPWNIVKVKDKYIPFDFEYFVEDGLEYFDIIKYYYQIGKLLEAKAGEGLYAFVKEQVSIPEFSELFELFLVKEIVRQSEEGEAFIFEENMLKAIIKEK